MQTKILLFLSFLFIYTCTFGQKRDAWTAIPITLPGESYAGKDIRFSAMVKKGREGHGRAYLWLRVDKKDQTQGFFDNMRDKPIKSTEWKRYTIEGTVDKEAQSIVFGVLNYCDGKFYYDDLKLEVKNDNGKWENVPFPNPGFEEGLNGYPIDKLKNYMAEEGYQVKIETDNAAEGNKCLLIEGSKSEYTTLFYDLGSRLEGFWSTDRNNDIVQYKMAADENKLIQNIYNDKGVLTSTSFIMYDTEKDRVICDFRISNLRTSLGEGKLLKDGMEVSLTWKPVKRNRTKYAELVGGEAYLENSLNTKFSRKVSLHLKDNDNFELHQLGLNLSIKDDSIKNKFENTIPYKRIDKPNFLK